MSKYIVLYCLISAVRRRGKRNLCILCKGTPQLPNLLITETYRSLHFWLAAEVRRDNSSTAGVSIALVLRRELCLVNIG